jgi:hypothetical protein
MEAYTKLVLKHLEKYGKITSWEAFTKYHCTRLSAVIFQLRKTHKITTSDVYYQTKDGKLKKYGLYKLEK